jgi:hypothetical protein
MLNVSGPEAEKKAGELVDFIENEFAFKPVCRKPGSGRRSTGYRSVDPLAIAAFVVAVPSALVATIDLVERRKKKEKLDRLLQWLKDKNVQVTITTPNGTTLQLDAVKSADFLDAADD